MGTCRAIWENGLVGGRTNQIRPLIISALCGVAILLGGLPALVALAVARVVLYPSMAWFSLIVEHRWFDVPALGGGGPREIEGRRCLRIYPRRWLLESILRTTVLPYGDLFHYVHSVHPTVRWNYLPELERLIGLPYFVPSRIILGRASLVAVLYRSLRDAGSPVAGGRPVSVGQLIPR